jgi:recombination protein RecA
MAKQPTSSKSKDLLEQKLLKLRSEFGDSFITIHEKATALPRISTGVLALDNALGGGFVSGRCTELFGKSAGGKTTLAIFMLIQAQKQYPEKTVIYIDAEHALDVEWAVKLGIHLDHFIHVKPETLEQGFKVIEEYFDTNLISAMVYDSIPAAVPQVALEGEIGDANVGIHARLLAQCMPRITTKMSRFNEAPALIFINQKRANLNSRQGFQGEQSKATGGFAFPHYMTTRMEVTRIGSLKDSDEKEYGQTVQVYVAKHKATPGHGARITFRIDNTIGIDTDQELLEMALDSGEIVKSGSWFVLPDSSKVQGEQKAKLWIAEQRKLKS